MSIPSQLKDQLSLPVIGAPMFILSNPDLVIAQCIGGVIGAFPALNARPKEALEDWIVTIQNTLADVRRADPSRRVAPFAVNQIIHHSNDRLDHDLDICIRHKVPLIITSLRAPGDIVKPVHEYGGLIFHDVVSIRHAEKALEAGVDGLVLVCAGAGGHAGTLSPFALVSEIRSFYDGPIALSGAISNGKSILAAQAMGADFAYMGTRFIATKEAGASQAYKEALITSTAEDIVYTPYFTGVAGNYLRASILAAGLDPEKLPNPQNSVLTLTTGPAKAWRDIWGAGQGVGSIHDIPSTANLIDRLKREYIQALTELTLAQPF